MVVIPREILATWWDSKATIYITQQEQNPTTKFMEVRDFELYKDEPCRVSYKTKVSGMPSAPSDTVMTAYQDVILIISSELRIPKGAKVVVTQLDRTTEYYASGEPLVYSSHQQIGLKLKDDLA